MTFEPEFFADLTAKWHASGYEQVPVPPDAGWMSQDAMSAGALTHIAKLHAHNYSIWHLEDVCRGNDDLKLAKAKRLIDKHNQARCDCAEVIDDWHLRGVNLSSNVFIVSEGIGSIIDRISVTDLKIWHTNELLDKVAGMKERLKILREQQRYLFECGVTLLQDLKSGVRCWRVFRQLKMYNDPATNSKLGK